MTWDCPRHTKAKHDILRRYLGAWFPIMATQSPKIVYIDGFAGPGEYSDGEEGSPVIAMRALVDHASQQVIKANVAFVFIEKDPARAEHLKQLVDGWRPQLPPGTSVRVVEGRFDGSMTSLLDQIDEQGKEMAPALVMIDPFGIKGTSMDVVARILTNRTCEVYVTFMYEYINRFLGTEEFEPNLTDLFGTEEWRGALELVGDNRRAFLYRLYDEQLRSSGAKHVVHFDLYEGNRLVYSIFFGTQHHR